MLLDLPSRNLSMLPNGLGYVHNAIKRPVSAMSFTIWILWHTIVITCIEFFNLGTEPVLPSGKGLPKIHGKLNTMTFGETRQCLNSCIR